MTIYAVKHFYDVDGGYGDAIGNEETVAIFENKDDAQAFVDKYSKETVYDHPYNDLYFGKLEIDEVDLVSHSEFDINKAPCDFRAYVPSSWLTEYKEEKAAYAETCKLWNYKE